MEKLSLRSRIKAMMSGEAAQMLPLRDAVPPILILYLPGQPFLNFCAYSSVSGLNHPGIKFCSKSLMPFFRGSLSF